MSKNYLNTSVSDRNTAYVEKPDKKQEPPTKSPPKCPAVGRGSLRIKGLRVLSHRGQVDTCRAKLRVLVLARREGASPVAQTLDSRNSAKGASVLRVVVGFLEARLGVGERDGAPTRVRVLVSLTSPVPCRPKVVALEEALSVTASNCS